jgi:predicted dehydrogenase
VNNIKVKLSLKNSLYLLFLLLILNGPVPKTTILKTKRLFPMQAKVLKFKYSIRNLLFILMILPLFNSCNEGRNAGFTGESGEVKLLILAPAHYHAHAIHRRMYDQIDPTVHVYAPEGSEVDLHVSMVEGYNVRENNATSWDQVVYAGEDYLEKMLSEKKGNVVLLAGNNRRKTTYIKRAVDAGLNVFSDKPMAIDMENFELLKAAFASADRNNVILYDMMTSRHSMTNILTKEIMQLPQVFGELDKGTLEDPAIIKENVHYFYKYVSGSLLRRPPWYFDVRQQGDGIVDVTTHLVDQVQWACFPEQAIDYRTDIDMISARRWPTAITRSQFESITGIKDLPAYLNDYIENDTVIQIYANGEMDYTIKGVHTNVRSIWNYSAPEGEGDTHYTFIRGSRANLIVDNSGLSVEPTVPDTGDFEKTLFREFAAIQEKYPGVHLRKAGNRWQVVIPGEYRADAFTQSTEQYLRYLIEGMPEWEVPNMISRYYTTTKALEMARNETLDSKKP